MDYLSSQISNDCSLISHLAASSLHTIFAILRWSFESNENHESSIVCVEPQNTPDVIFEKFLT